MLFFVSACVTHSLVERLAVLFGNKDKNSGNEEAQQSMKIYKRRLLLPLSQRNMYRKMKGEITSQKKTIQRQKYNVTAKDQRPLLLFYFTDFDYVFVD